MTRPPNLALGASRGALLLLLPLLGAGCERAPTLPRCPDTAPLAFSMSCEPLRLEETCRPPELQSASLGALASGLPSVEFAPLDAGLLVVQVSAEGALVATRFDAGAVQVGSPIELERAVGELLAMRLLPAADGFTLHALRLESPGSYALLQLRLDAAGVPSTQGLETVWTFDGEQEAPVEVRWGSSSDGARTLAVVSLPRVGFAHQELWGLEVAVDREPGATETPFLIVETVTGGAAEVRAGDVIGAPEGGYVVAGVDSFGELGQVWARTVPGNVELWRSEPEPVPEQARVLLDPASLGQSSYVVGWYSPGRIDNEFAALRRAEGVSEGGTPWLGGIEYGPWWGVGGLGRVLQTLTEQDGRWVQLSFEASVGELPGTELAELFAYDSVANHSPFGGRNLVPSWPGFDTLRAVRTQGEGLVTAIPVVGETGELSLGVYRMCL